MTDNRRPMFGPKRIGWGYRPQTPLAWLLIMFPVVVAVIVVVLVAR